MTRTLDGVLVVDKPEGVTSHDVVAAVRRRLTRGCRVGHTGTLDPLASGVLALVIGKATRLSPFLTAGRKRYTATIAFGTSTTTDDRAGSVTARADATRLAALDAAAVHAALAGFLGTDPQVPPAHSAKRIAGHRAYDLARRGAAVDLPGVPVTAFALELTAWDGPGRQAIVALETSAGYYVRSLARDLGEAVGVPAHLSALRRTANGEFTLADAHGLGDLVEVSADALAHWCRPLSALLGALPAVVLTAAQSDAVRRGQPIMLLDGQQAAFDGGSGRVRLLDGAGALLALAREVDRTTRALHADVVLA